MTDWDLRFQLQNALNALECTPDTNQKPDARANLILLLKEAIERLHDLWWENKCLKADAKPQPPADAPVIYDINIDDRRKVTQEDVDRLMRAAQEGADLRRKINVALNDYKAALKPPKES